MIAVTQAVLSLVEKSAGRTVCVSSELGPAVGRLGEVSCLLRSESSVEYDGSAAGIVPRETPVKVKPVNSGLVVNRWADEHRRNCHRASTLGVAYLWAYSNR